MCIELFCSPSRASITGLAVLQLLFHSTLVIGFILARVYLDPYYDDIGDALEFGAAVNAFSSLVTVLLCIGLATKKYKFIRYYVNVKCSDVVINNLFLLIFFIFHVTVTKEYLTLAACPVPFFFLLWGILSIGFVCDFYKAETGEEIPGFSTKSKKSYDEENYQKDLKKQNEKDIIYTVNVYAVKDRY